MSGGVSDTVRWNWRLPRFGGQTCSSVAVVLSSLAVMSICFVYFDLAVAPTSLLLQLPAAYGSQAEASRTVASSDAEPSQRAALPWQSRDLIPAPLSSRPRDTDPSGSGRPAESGESCDFCSGRWVRDNASYPLYRSQDCPFVDAAFRCQENRRPDREYEQWRWQPDGCDLPRVEAGQVLERLRGSRLVFVGDSLGRNQWESMLCVLASGAAGNRSRVYEVDGNPITKRGYLRFRFEDHNCTVEYYRAPFLVSHGRAPVGHPAEVTATLKLDQMDWTSSAMWEGADVLVFNSGHWWTPGKTVESGVFFQEGRQVNTSMGIQEAFARALRTWSSWVESKVDPTRTRVFFRSFASAHFRGGAWNGGGHCDSTQPYGIDESFDGAWSNDVIVRELANVPHVTYLNITRLTDYRKDAHPSVWTAARVDCSHWCLPGVPDSWNEILIAELMKIPSATT